MMYGIIAVALIFVFANLPQYIRKQLKMCIRDRDRAERLKEEDLMAGVGFLVLLPMITGVVKMLADLVLVILGILSVVNTIQKV